MTALFQVLGAVATVVSLVGTWLAARRRAGWLLCVASSALWFPALFLGNEWAAECNCLLSIAVCVRNFVAQTSADTQDANATDLLVLAGSSPS